MFTTTTTIRLFTVAAAALVEQRRIGVEEVEHEPAVRDEVGVAATQTGQLALDARIFKHYGDQIEVERAHTLVNQPGTLRILAFRNRAVSPHGSAPP